ncbi:hypothetical protein ACFYO5_15985 [Streptomyces sp. NPDC006259]|uniref:hypothetical protein n=1 Tax=Streptomyces sp. NPDC006259 TaxID=3364740 RepID=UPI00368BE244
MITRSIRPGSDGAVPSSPPITDAERTAPQGDGTPSPAPDARTAYPDPIEGLLHATVVHRSLEDVALLVALLEESEEGRQAAVGVLRAIGTDRPVEDVTRLVAVLSRPPYEAGHADHMIRAAAENRPVEEVTRLMALLYREPLEQHCGDEAVLAAATHRPVEELAELVARLARQREEQAARQRQEQEARQRQAGLPAGPWDHVPGVPEDPLAPFDVLDGPPPRPAEPPPYRTPAPARAPAPTVSPWAAWTDWAAAVTLALCGVAHVAVHRQGVPVGALATALALSGLCLLLALALLRRPALPLLVLGVLAPAVFAGAQVFAGRVAVVGLSPLTEATLAPPWIAGPVAAVTAVTVTVALLVHLLDDRRPARAPAPDRRTAVLPARD